MSPVNLALSSKDWKHGLTMAAALFGLDEIQTAQLLQLAENPPKEKDEPVAEVLQLLQAVDCLQIAIYLGMNRRTKAGAFILDIVDPIVLEGLNLPSTAKATLVRLAIEANLPIIIEALGPGASAFPSYEHPLLYAIRGDKEDVAIALVRMGFSTRRVKEIQGFMPVYEVHTSPILVALSMDMNRFLEVCFTEGHIQGSDIMTDLGLSQELYDWLMDRPDLIDQLSLDWKTANTMLHRGQDRGKLIIKIWPAVTRAFAFVDQSFIFKSRMIGETVNCRKVTPLLLNCAVCAQMPAPDFQILIGDFIIENYDHCSPEFIQTLCSIGVSPTFACDWCIKNVAVTTNDKGEVEKKELPNNCITLCSAAFEGTLQFLDNVKALAPCPYIQSLCLNALGDLALLVEALAKTLELSYLPKHLHDLIQNTYDAVIALSNVTDINLVPSLQDLSAITLFSTLGLNNCTPEIIGQLTGGQTELSTLSERMLKLITLIAMEYKRQGAWPNPLAAFAFVALLELEHEFAWLSEVYGGSAEVEDS